MNPVFQVVVHERREPVLPELRPYFVHSVYDERQHFFAAERLSFAHAVASQLVQQLVHRRLRVNIVAKWRKTGQEHAPATREKTPSLKLELMSIPPIFRYR